MQIFLQFLISLFIFGGLERITHVQNNWLLSFLLLYRLIDKVNVWSVVDE
ncbi:MAG: hypothetical protein U0K39_05720 [Latilactobacillus curvatus]|nr:hypothetical protein [Latilactobacillus curvatus]